MKAYSLVTILFLATTVSNVWAAPKPVWSCQSIGNAAGLEDLSIYANPDGKLTASLEVSGPGDFMETYHYSLNQPEILKADTHLEGKNFSLKFVSKAAKGLVYELTAIGPKHSELNSNARIHYHVLCQRSK